MLLWLTGEVEVLTLSTKELNAATAVRPPRALGNIVMHPVMPRENGIECQSIRFVFLDGPRSPLIQRKYFVLYLRSYHSFMQPVCACVYVCVCVCFCECLAYACEVFCF